MNFWLVLKKNSEEDWALGYKSMNFLDFSEILYFRNISSVKSFGNSWGNSYIPYLLLIITFRLSCGKKKIWSNFQNLKIL